MSPFARIRALSDRTARLALAVTQTSSIPRVRRLRSLIDRCEATRAGLLERVTWPQHPAPQLRAFLDRMESLGASRTPTPGVAREVTTPAGAST